MASEAPSPGASEQKPENQRRLDDKRQRSILELPATFFNSCRLLQSPSASLVSLDNLSVDDPIDFVEDEASKNDEAEDFKSNSNNVSISKATAMQRLSCNTCKAEFESLQEQRSHFKSDIHRLNVKLSVAGKVTIKEEDFDETTSNSLLENYDISSISGSDDEDEKESVSYTDPHSRLPRNVRNRLFIQLQKGERVSIWRCLILDESEHITFENNRSIVTENNGSYLTEKEVTEKLKYVIHEPRDSTCLRVVLLARGGHFAGCVFDGTSVVTHKTFHRYVVRAKAGKKQSSKDAGGSAIHSAGASLRRHNELALKKDIQELLAAWKPYFALSSCIFLHAPSNNRQLFFDGERAYFVHQPHVIRNIPLTVRRPTFREARRIYNLLTEVSYEIDEETASTAAANIKEDTSSARHVDSVGAESIKSGMVLETSEISAIKKYGNEHVSSNSESESETTCLSTPLHEAAKSGNPHKVLELLEEGFDPCVKDERGQTPYMLATEKEVRNTFRRFMGSNLDKWDWYAAKVPSALTKEMEESQAAKQAEKDAKRKARAKELKKLRKVREKKAQAEAAKSNNAPSMSKEEELKRAQDAEREKRAAAAERRIAALAAAKAQSTESEATSSRSRVTDALGIICSCCHVSLAGKVPFHRYNYKYCSTTCMHLHKEILEDG